jgi:ketosteroid isomerase-like protein
MLQTSENTLKVGYQAFENLMHGFATSDWNSFLNILTDDFTFWFPTGQYHGLNVGKERAKEFLQYVTEVFGQTLKLTCLDKVTSNETTVVFEFCDEGIMRGELYKNRIAISFDVRDDKVCSYREYFGSDGKSN